MKSAGNISCTLMYTAGTEGKKNAHFFLSFSLYHPSTCIRVTPTRSNSLRAQSPTATVGSFRTADYTYTSVDDCNTVSRIKQQRRRQHLATPKTFLSHDSAIRKINRKITSLAITSLPKRLDQHTVAGSRDVATSAADVPFTDQSANSTLVRTSPLR